MARIGKFFRFVFALEDNAGQPDDIHIGVELEIKGDAQRRHWRVTRSQLVRPSMSERDIARKFSSSSRKDLSLSLHLEQTDRRGEEPVMKTPVRNLSSAIVIACLALMQPVHGAMLEGQTISVTNFHGTASDMTLVIGPASAVVGAGIEFDNFGWTGFVDIDVSDTRIVITLNTNQPFGYSEVLRFTDPKGKFAFTSATVNAATNWAGFNQSRVIVIADLIDVHVSNLQGLQGQQIVLDVTAVPTGPAADGDFDGDGRPDIAVFRPSTGVWWISYSGTTGYATIQWGESGDIPVPGDYDGDRRADIAVFRPSTGVWWISYSGTTGYAAIQWGESGDIPVPGDYDGDGATDITVYRPASGHWFILKSSTGFTASDVYQWGIGGDIPVPADYDGDGRTDLTVYRPASGDWFVLLSSTNFTAWSVYQFGESLDVPVSGDYDGDGAADITVYRPASGHWFILKSSTGFTASDVYQWGISGDIPVPADYDGDGRTDITVYRPASGQWFVLKSSTNYLTWDTYQWGETGDIPVLQGPQPPL
jgi:hypothetical protein